METPRLVRRRECWLPTALGWVALLIVISSASFVLLFSVHPFLAPTHPVRGPILVAEGWMPDYGLEAAAQEYRRGGYRLLVVTGGPLETGFYLSSYHSFAELGAATLRAQGLDSACVVPVPAPAARKDRTFASARALKAWLAQSGQAAVAVDVCSMGAHARRTRMLFAEVLEPGVRVGIIACQDRQYDGNRWWRSSAGVRTVTGEAVAYLYARFFFRGDP